MTYTQNHRLPQWEPADRIRMSDFNDAMSAIDGGLAANEAKTFDSLCRLAYNHYNLLQDTESLSKWIGAFRQGFARADSASVTGGYQKDDRIWIANSTETPTQASLKSLVEAQGLNFFTYTAVYTFTTTCMGRLRSIDVNGQYAGHDSSRDDTLTVRLINQRTGEVEATGSSSMNISINNSYSNYAFNTTLRMDIPFHGGQDYRLELERNDKYSNFQVALNANLSTTCMTFDKITDVPASASAVHSLREAEDAQGALVLVHYDLLGSQDAAVTLQFSGRTIGPHTTRSVTNSQGRTMTEAEFRINQTIPASCGMTLQASCGNGGEMEMFDWSGMLI